MMKDPREVDVFIHAINGRNPTTDGCSCFRALLRRVYVQHTNTPPSSPRHTSYAEEGRRKMKERSRPRTEKHTVSQEHPDRSMIHSIHQWSRDPQLSSPPQNRRDTRELTRTATRQTGGVWRPRSVFTAQKSMAKQARERAKGGQEELPERGYHTT